MALATALPDISGILDGPQVHRNLSASSLVEQSIQRGESRMVSNGALVAYTAPHTGRSPKDKFIVRDATTESKVKWTGFNQPIDPEKFDRIYEKVTHYLRGRELFVQELYCGADPQFRLHVRFINEFAWHNLFVKELFVRPAPGDLKGFTPEFTVIGVPGCLADPKTDGTNSQAFILTDFTRKLVLIGGTKYAGELKKCIFGVMNFVLPERDVFPMHCSANVGRDGTTALFFGLSGTGKTTLSADPHRQLIGDDEHGWGSTGIFNFEGGCYAKCIRLSREGEPQIYNAIRFGAVLENVVIDPDTREPKYDDDSNTENTRAAYPVDFIDNAMVPGMGGHPKNVVFLTADAFGVLPPIAKLTPDQAMYHFLSGYTAKLAGTEAGVGKEPQPNFSTCFAAPFLPLPPRVYAKMLGERLTQHNAQCWLVNTGWVGGPYGVGSRMKLNYTRAMVRAAVDGHLKDAEYETEPVFGLAIPKSVPDVPSELLNPRNLWPDKAGYDKQAADLAARFVENFKKFEVPDSVKNAGPKLKG
jgi:phosphoenolpyruvate carboxykinase (ATP)